MRVAPPGRAAGLASVAWLLLLASILLAGCGGPRKPDTPEYHVVRAGDTLYSIGWRYRLDYRDLARWNGIGRDYRIYQGQKLRLRPPAGGVAAKPPSRPAGSSAQPRPKPPPAKLPPAPPWRWPVEGLAAASPVTQPSGAIGLRVDGVLGTPVLAAADGRVVYTGSGLHGYGVVIILSHANGWLTAYGHNATVLVNEGDAVTAGQRVATMGLGPGQRPMLYFEVRHEGTPVDPLSQLPRR